MMEMMVIVENGSGHRRKAHSSDHQQYAAAQTTASTDLFVFAQHDLDPIHRHGQDDLLLLDGLGLEFVLQHMAKRNFNLSGGL